MAREDTRTEQPTANAGRPDGGTSGKPAAESPASKNFFATTPGLVLGALISCALWGSAFPMIKIGNPLFGIATGDAASQILFAGIRFTISGILTIVAVSLVRRRPLCPRTGDDFRKALILSLFQTAGQYALFYPGVSRSSGITASIIEASNVFITVFIAALVFRSERLTSRKLLGCAALGGHVKYAGSKARELLDAIRHDKAIVGQRHGGEGHTVRGVSHRTDGLAQHVNLPVG